MDASQSHPAPEHPGGQRDDTDGTTLCLGSQPLSVSAPLDQVIRK